MRDKKQETGSDEQSSREFEDQLEVADEVASDLDQEANQATIEESPITYSQ